MKRTTQAQFERIISFMEEHKDLATNKYAGLYGKQKIKELWETLAGPIKLRSWSTENCSAVAFRKYIQMFLFTNIKFLQSVI